MNGQTRSNAKKSETDARNKRVQGSTQKGPTWGEVLTFETPNIKSDWGNNNGMKGKLITKEAVNQDNDKYGFTAINNDMAEAKILEESMMITSGSNTSPHRDTKH